MTKPVAKYHVEKIHHDDDRGDVAEYLGKNLAIEQVLDLLRKEMTEDIALDLDDDDHVDVGRGSYDFFVWRHHEYDKEKEPKK